MKQPARYLETGHSSQIEIKGKQMNIIHKVPSIIVPVLDNWEDVLNGKLTLRGHVTCEHYRKDELIHRQEGSNTFITEGMARMCNIIFGVTAKTGAIGVYVGLFKNNITPVVGDTAAKLGSGNAYGECQDADYTPATNRPNYTIVPTATAGCTNAAAKAEFTMAAQLTPGVYGAFLAMSQAKTDVTGPLLCAKRFASVRATEIADVLAVTYVITMTAS
jgi:hypothetical protein